ncbi:MAG: hypothetical protein DRQ47_06010 [Gammaproteobacteria bacterium]|nr:MAG: hypothetical protein DRQ47_06010 [Gammaproteobacteria bacterium]
MLFTRRGVLTKLGALLAAGLFGKQALAAVTTGGAGSANPYHVPGDLIYDNTYWDDCRLVPGGFRFAGASDPTLVDWQPGGSGATFKVYEFGKNDEAFGTAQLSHRYKLGTDLYFHAHWTPGPNGAAENGNLVGWKIDYSIISFGGTFVASSTVDLSDACQGTAHENLITPDVQVSGTGLGISSIAAIRIYRSDTGADDTWSGTATGSLPLLLEFDIHFEIDEPGSSDRVVK